MTKGDLNRLGRTFVPYVGFIVVFVTFSIALSRYSFASWTNLRAIIEQTAPVAIMAVGFTFTLAAGEIDLSIGSTVALVALVTALVLQGGPLWLALLAGLGVGLAIGLVNGLLTVLLRVPSFLITLGMLSVVGGISEQITNLQSLSITNADFTGIFGSGSVGPFPSLLLWLVAALLVGQVMLRKLRYGRHVLAVGGSRDAASAVGIRVRATRVSVLVASSLTAALAGILYAGRLQGASYTYGGNAAVLTVVAATIIGGTSLNGGRGSVPGSIVGALLLGMLQEGLILWGLSVPYQMIAEGIVIIIAVGVSLRERAQ